MKNREQFKKELTELINKLSLESGCNIPDFIIAEYLTECFEAFESATKEADRLKWTYYQTKVDWSK